VLLAAALGVAYLAFHELVTLSLQQLERRGLITREGGRLLLIGEPPHAERQGASAALAS